MNQYAKAKCGKAGGRGRARIPALLVAGLAALAAGGCGDGDESDLIIIPATLRQAAGSDAASIQSAVDQFRTDLGALNANEPQSFTGGRREINWDGVPDNLASPNSFPADFFNGTAAPRARGVVFSTPGSGFQVSAKSGNPTGTPTLFGNLNAGFGTIFAAFSPERIFTALDSNQTDVTFFLPGTTTPANTPGFGVVFTDVDSSSSTRIEFRDVNGDLRATVPVPAAAGTAGFSFAGATFATPFVARVRIISGATVLGSGSNDAATDVVAMDDFIYGEPAAR